MTLLKVSSSFLIAIKKELLQQLFKRLKRELLLFYFIYCKNNSRAHGARNQCGSYYVCHNSFFTHNIGSSIHSQIKGRRYQKTDNRPRDKTSGNTTDICLY